MIGVGIDNSCASLYVFRLSQAPLHGFPRRRRNAEYLGELGTVMRKRGNVLVSRRIQHPPLQIELLCDFEHALHGAHFLAEVGHLHEARTVPRVAGNGMLVIDHANRDTFLSEAANNAKALIVSADNDRTDVFALREWLLPASSRSNTILRCAVHRNSRDHVQASSQS